MRASTPTPRTQFLVLCRLCCGERRRRRRLQENGLFLSAFPIWICLSRACLGKKFVFIYKWQKKTVVFTYQDLRVVDECQSDVAVRKIPRPDLLAVRQRCARAGRLQAVVLSRLPSLPPLSENTSRFFCAFPRFVPSLSWQNHHFRIKWQRKKTRFLLPGVQSCPSKCPWPRQPPPRRCCHHSPWCIWLTVQTPTPARKQEGVISKRSQSENDDDLPRQARDKFTRKPRGEDDGLLRQARDKRSST